jgi:hypothetical protein
MFFFSETKINKNTYLPLEFVVILVGKLVNMRIDLQLDK